MMRLSRLRPPRSKRSVLMVGVGILLILAIVGGYMLWSKQVWAEYTPSYTQRHQEIQSNIKEAATLPVTNAKEQDATLARLKDVSSNMATEQKALCTVNIWVQWQQQMISAYRDAQDACREKASDITTFQNQLNLVIIFIENDRALAKIIDTVVPPNELADNAWGEQEVAWNSAIAAATKLSVSDAYKPTQQRAVEKMTAVKQGWIEFVAAHQQKDKVKYLAAQSKIGTSYDELNAIADESTKGLNALTKVLNASYVRAFN